MSQGAGPSEPEAGKAATDRLDAKAADALAQVDGTPAPHQDADAAFVPDALGSSLSEGQAQDAAPEEPRSAHQVKKKLFSASIWSIVASLGTQGSTFVIFVILARLLEPKDFGLVAFATVFIDLTRGIMLGGIPEALIQRKVWSNAAASTAFWLNILAGGVFSSGLAIIAIAVWYFGSHTLLWPVLAALSTTLMIDGLRSVQEARLRRDFEYKKLAARSIVAAIIGGIAGIVAAVMGAGIWALVINRLTTSIGQTLIVWTASKYRPTLKFDRQEVGPLLRFSSSVLVGRSLGQLNGRMADLVLGALAGPAVLGFYRVGTRSLYFLEQAAIAPLQATTLSAFSRLGDAQAKIRAYGRFTQLCSTIAFPAYFGAAAIAPDFISVFFGEKWSQSAVVMMAMAFGVIPMMLLAFFQPALQAIGRPRAIIVPEFVRLGIGGVVLSAAAPFGLLFSTLGEVARRYLMLPYSLMVLKKELGISPLALLRGLVVPLLWSMMFLGTIVLLRETLWSQMNPLLRLTLSVPLGATIYCGGLFVFSRPFLRDVFSSLKSGLPGPLQKIGEKILGT
jgi:PST family polysaccharide transporter